MSAGQQVTLAYSHLKGVLGKLTLILETKRGIRPTEMADLAIRLRGAADALDVIGASTPHTPELDDEVIDERG